MRRPYLRASGYAAVLLTCLAVATIAGFTSLGAQLDDYAADWLFRLTTAPARLPQSIILAADGETLRTMGGMPRLRQILTTGLRLLAPAKPVVVALDAVLADEEDPMVDRALADAIRGLPVILASDLLPNGQGWEDPTPVLRLAAQGMGHVHVYQDADGVSRRYALEKAAGHDRRWALALEALRRRQGLSPVLESQDGLQVGGLFIPAPRDPERGRPLRIRFVPDPIPQISIAQLQQNPRLAAAFTGKAVFVGSTAVGAIRDHLTTPYGAFMTGVEIHAQAFETMVHGDFLYGPSPAVTLLLGFVLAAAAGLIFWFLVGWRAYAVAGCYLAAVHLLPYWCFRHNVVLPAFSVIASGWLCIIGAASFQYFVTRLRLAQTETRTAHYQQAIHWVTHEMRTPLTAIQGSSELMGRYNLTEEKRKQMASMIHTESKRLARMIQTFLDVERLSEGQMELKHETFALADVVSICCERARPLAERKGIRIEQAPLPSAEAAGDRELMEYAVYNLLTNAVKYSPPDTEVLVSAGEQGGQWRLSVRDQGMGMDAKEVRRIFQKFYRTKRAEQSGEVGTGIGLSIVDQIITHHGGRIEVTSTPGKGSCFTLVLPKAARAASLEVSTH